jgi:hypothetical protein
MTRDDIKAIFDEAAKVEIALGALTHRDAVPAIEALQAIRDIVGEELPGGCAGLCPMCEEIKGEDELVDAGDERICSTCYEAALPQAAKADA